MIKKKIIFNLPKLAGNELKNFNSLNKYNHYSSNGYFTKKCKSWLIKNIKCKDAILVNSCTAALEISAILIDIKPGDEVIMPSYTFVSTANAFVLRGAKIIFIDLDKETLNMNINLIEKNITKKTKAIVTVHYAGISVDLDKIVKIAKKNKLFLIEDAAQAILSKYKDRYLGTFGDLATFSFHETKNIHCGEGGALLINNKKFIKRASIIKDKGTNRNDFNKKLVKKYYWVDLGSSYGLNEINASFLYSQLISAKKINNSRLKIWKFYYRQFKHFESEKKMLLPFIPNYSHFNGHIFYIIVKKDIRNRLLNFLNKNYVMALFHYVPLHNSPFGKIASKKRYNLELTDLKSNSIIRMPLHLSIKKSDIIKIKKLMIKFFSQEGSKALL